MTTVIARLQKGQKIGGHFEPEACASGSKWPPISILVSEVIGPPMEIGDWAKMENGPDL